MLENENIILLTSAPLESYMVRRPHHIGKGLAEKNSVINISSRLRIGYGDKSKHGPWESKLFKRLPFTRFRCVGNINRILFRRYVKGIIRSLNPPPIIFVYGVPNIDLYDNCPRKLLVYELTDDMPAFFKNDPKKKAEMQKEVGRMLKLADVTFVVSEELYNKVKTNNQNIYLVRNGVDLEYFGKAAQKGGEIPSDLQQIEKPIVGYLGAISPWIDFKLFKEVSRLLPEMNFVLIGRIDQRCQKDVDELESMKNVWILGEKPYEKLVDYVRHFDIAIIPFILDELAVSINPIKLYEYLAAGKPVVSTPIPEAKHYEEEGILSVATNAVEWKERILKMLRFTKDVNYINRRVEIAGMNSWDNRVAEMQGILRRFIQK